MSNKPTATSRWNALLQRHGSFAAIEQKLFQQGTPLRVLATRVGAGDAFGYRQVRTALVAGITKHSPARARQVVMKIYELIGKEPNKEQSI